MAEQFHDIGDDFPLSQQQRDKLHDGETVTILYRTPGMLVGKIGHQHGRIDIREVDGRPEVLRA